MAQLTHRQGKPPGLSPSAHPEALQTASVGCLVAGGAFIHYTGSDSDKNRLGKIHSPWDPAFSAATYFFLFSSTRSSDLLGCHALVISLGQLKCKVNGEPGCLTSALLGIVSL